VLKIASEIIRLGQLARDGKLAANDMRSGTFSITNYGSFGALAGVPIINYPELALAGIGAITDKVALVNGQISARKSMLLTVAADHR
jgi:pyruvate dehydrogenase E2 component (dihydrolipoamide acetyltransferase)